MMKLRVISMYKELFLEDGWIGIYFGIWLLICLTFIIGIILVIIYQVIEYLGEWFIFPISGMILLIILEFILWRTE